MKFPPRMRQLTRRALGMGSSQPITPEALHALAATEPVILIGVGIVNPGSTDDRLPGEQRVASLSSIASVVADVPKHRAIVTHCG